MKSQGELMMTVIEKINLKELYEIDDNLWLEKTIDLLKEKKFNELDLKNLIEELESLARRDKLAMASLLQQVIRHLLLLQYWQQESEQNSSHWRAEILSFRYQLNDRMTTNFHNYLEDNLPSIYSKASKYVAEKSRLNTFPQQCTYTLKQLLDEDWFPNSE